jgi:hypothetical protein
MPVPFPLVSKTVAVGEPPSGFMVVAAVGAVGLFPVLNCQSRTFVVWACAARASDRHGTILIIALFNLIRIALL